MTYHFNSRITRWPLTFRQVRKDIMLYSICQEYNRQWYLIYVLQIYWFQYYYHRYQLISKTCHLEGNQRILKTKRYTESTLYRRKIEMVNASRCSSSRIRCIQKAQYRLSYLLRRHSRKNTIDRADKNTRRKNKQRQYTGKTFLFRKRNFASQKSSSIELSVLVG